MGKGLDKFLNIMRLNDDNYDDDYDEDYDDGFMDEFEDEYDDYEDTPAVSRKKHTPFKSRKAETAPEPEPAPAPRSAASNSFSGNSAYSSTSARAAQKNKIVPMKAAGRNTGLEVSIQKPKTFDDCKEICDELLGGKVTVINLEGLEVTLAQRIIDFVFGACCAISGEIQQVSRFIFVVVPAGIDFTGDIESVIQSGTGSKVDMPAFHLSI